MKVNTVLGELDANNLGIISPHEHIFLDIRQLLEELPPKLEVTKNNLFNEKVSMSNLGDLRMNVYSVLDNLILSDEEDVLNEILEFKKFGGNTIIDQTNECMGRDPIALKNISIMSGLNIITCTGYYVKEMHPKYVKDININDLSEIMIKEINEGIGGTDIKAGIIGEIGTSTEVLEDEEKILKASAIAQKETNIPLFIHTTWPWGRTGIEILDILKKYNVNMGKVIICHVDGKIELEYYKELLNRGVYIEFEQFGKDYGFEIYDEYVICPNDLEKIKAIYELINFKENFINKILLANDICHKIDYKKYGGHGYAHVLKNIIPLMKLQGFTKKQVNILIEKNPISLFA